MRHFLAGMAPDHPVNSKPVNWNLDYIRDIVENEYNEITIAKKAIKLFQNQTFLHNIFVYGCDEFEQLRTDLIQHILNRNARLNLSIAIMMMDAKLMAVLAYFKSFLEFWKDRFKDTNDQYYMNLTNDLLNGNSSYRICYYLRNYAQHYSSPLVSCVIEADAEKRDVHFYVNRESIINSSVRWKTKEDDLRKLPKILLDAHLGELRKCVKELHYLFVGYDFQKVKSSKEFLHSLCVDAQTNAPGTETCIVTIDPDDVPLKITSIPHDQLTLVDNEENILMELLGGRELNQWRDSWLE